MSNPPMPSRSCPPRTANPPAPVTVLVVDDHQANLISLEVVLTELGYVALLANSGSEALKYLLEEEDISCVLLDVRMPVIDGFETAALIRKRERHKDLPIIFMTATQ